MTVAAAVDTVGQARRHGSPGCAEDVAAPGVIHAYEVARRVIRAEEVAPWFTLRSGLSALKRSRSSALKRSRPWLAGTPCFPWSGAQFRPLIGGLQVVKNSGSLTGFGALLAVDLWITARWRWVVFDLKDASVTAS